MVDSRDQLWEAVYETYYFSYFEEILSDALLIRWQRVDDITKLIVALAASSSAITGLVVAFADLDHDLKWLWPTITGVAALFALVHKEMAVPYRLRDHADNKQSFQSLRIDLETFRYLMKSDSQFSVAEFTKKFEDFRKRYNEASRRLRVDSLVTKRLRERCQEELNGILANNVIQS